MDKGSAGNSDWLPQPEAAAMLDGFLDRLEAGTVRVGLRQRLSAHRLLAALVLRSAGPEDLPYARDMFTSLLATSPDEQRVIAAAFERDCPQLLHPRRPTAEAAQPKPATSPMPQSSIATTSRQAGWLTRFGPHRIAGAAMVVLVCGIVGYMALRPSPPLGDDPITDPTTTIGGNSGSGTNRDTTQVEGAWTERQLLEDLAKRVPPSLPSLREIWKTGWPPHAATGERKFTLAEMVRRTGFDPDLPLQIYEKAVQDRLVSAFGEFITLSGPNDETVAFGGAAASDLIRAMEEDLDRPLRSSAYLDLVTRPKEERIERIKTGFVTGMSQVALPDEVVDRALAVALDGQDLPANAFADADWQPGPPSAAHVPPPWLRWLLAAIPLLIYATWLWNWRRNSADHYRHFFARRRPLDHSLVVTAPNQILSTRTDRPYIKGIAHGLGVRQAIGATKIDAARTVERTARRGGLFDSVPGRITATPAYLFFIEARSPLDLEARRLDLLRQRLTAAGLDAKRYFYTQTPAVLYERFGGRPLPLEEVAAHDDDRRLIIMGEGAGFVDPATLKPEPWTRALDIWQERAMLSVKPVGSWGVEERAIARDLDLSLGRATIEGLTALPELLGLDSEADRPAMRAYGFSGGQDLKPLPLPLRSDPYRWLASAPPDESRDDWWPVLEYRLSLYLDQAGLDWLKALAVYPVLNWELTLYLGRGLHDAAGREFYAEPRLAALTRLPWLREGRMPEWLRDAMIESLDPVLRKQVIALIAGIVVLETGADRSIEILRQQNRWASDLGSDPGEDTLFLDTFAEEAGSGTLDLPPEFAERLASFRRELLVKALEPGAAATLLAAAAWWLTPDAASGVLRNGGYLPVAILFIIAGLGWLAVSGWPVKILRAISAAIERPWPSAATKPTVQTPQMPQPAAFNAEQRFIYVSHVPQDRERVGRLTADLRAQGVNLWLNHEHETLKDPDVSPADRAVGTLSILTEASRKAGFLTNYHSWLDVGRSQPLTIIMLEKVDIKDPALTSLVLDMTGGAYGGNIDYLARKLNAQIRTAESPAEQAEVAA